MKQFCFKTPKINLIGMQVGQGALLNVYIEQRQQLENI